MLGIPTRTEPRNTGRGLTFIYRDAGYSRLVLGWSVVVWEILICSETVWCRAGRVINEAQVEASILLLPSSSGGREP